MSGLAGFIQADRGPIDSAALEAMAGVLARRGPDATGAWTGDGVALIHTLFRTTDEARDERQPIVFGDRFVFVGDVRLDARDDVIARVAQSGGAVASSAPDAEIALHAWLAWRDDCVQHLRGDFAFAVWDRADRRLFAARDQFGVRPFYYAAGPRAFAFGNMIAAVRRHPDVPGDLDDAAIVDLLVFEQVQSLTSTAFAAIRRLPGGHVLVWQAGRAETRRYWTGPSDRPVRFRRSEDYLDRYRELLTRSVSDRLRTSRVTVAMTGGIDSSSIAVTAARLFADRGRGGAVEARTIVYDHLIPDREREFAGLVAQQSRIPIVFAAADDRPIYERASDPALQPPEPVNDPFRAMLTDFYRGIADSSRVLLMGLDGDTLLCEVASDYLLARLRRGQMGEYLRGIAAYIRTRGELPPHRLRTTVRALLGVGESRDQIPRWIPPALVDRFDLAARWAARVRRPYPLAPGWPLRPRAARVLGSPSWASMFDQHDAEPLGALVEARFPFTDIAFVEFLLGIPAVPWCIDKYIARKAMADRLPPEILARPKSPMAADTVQARLAKGDQVPWVQHFNPHPLLGRYVDVQMLDQICNRQPPTLDAWVDTRALTFNEWLWYHLPRS